MNPRFALTLLALLAGCGDTKGGGSTGLDEATVKQVIGAQGSAPGTMIVNNWRKVAILPPHAARAGADAGIAAGTQVYPVSVSLSRTVTRGGAQTAEDVKRDYLFYRRPGGDWTAAPAD